MKPTKNQNKSVCVCCRDRINNIDYKRTDVLRKFVTSQFKIFNTKRTGLCNKHQRAVSLAVKRARYMALMPYTKNQTLKN